MLARLLPRRTAAGDLLRRWRHRVAYRSTPPAPGSVEAVVDAFGAAHPRATFVQIGSNDGVRFDPICRQIRTRRWRGLMVEPLPWLFTRLEANFGGARRIRLVRAAVAEVDGRRHLHHLPPHEGDLGDLPPWYDAIGSFDRDVVLRHRDAIPDLEDRLRTTEVATMTFDRLCAEHGIDAIDVLHLDTEGYDAVLLATVDLDRWRPGLVLFEHLHLDETARADTLARLQARGYVAAAGAMDTVCLHRTALDGDIRLATAFGALRDG